MKLTMRSSSLSLKLAFSFSVSISLAVSLASSSPPSLPKIPSVLAFKSFSQPPPPSSPRSFASNLLALLGSPDDSSAVPVSEAREIASCFRFLVPFSPPSSAKNEHLRRCQGANDMIWWPPESVMELACLAIDSGGDPAVIQGALDPTPLPVPDVEGLKKDKCQLTSTPYGYRFVNWELNAYFAFLFELITERGPSVGLNVNLSRYDLFHGHLFIADSGRLGILFHAREYPEYNKESFPYNMGYCQRGSTVVYDDSMNLRNILWLAPQPGNRTDAGGSPGVLVVLDAHPDGIIYKELVPQYVDTVRTIFEDDFGDHVADVNYLNVRSVVPGDRIFMC
ncbi:uncharacterized protein LOC122017483 [Zingiber officinale]|uniref:uncharacterized protein LOC122017483 n=1 Tax=Zingiber officinale TaxID=94328 RepID=UPI001C4BBA32|nr:uncharacterized protein LOC122017483 [Zingiber officinale]